MIQTWSDLVFLSFQNLWQGMISSLPNLIAAIVIFVIGWVLAVFLSKMIEKALRALKLDRLFQTVGVENVLSKAGFQLDIGAFFGSLVKWFLIVVALVASMDVIGLTQVNDFLLRIVFYVPRVFVAILVLMAAAFVSDFVKRIVVGSAKATNLSSADTLGSVAKWAIWIFAILAALTQLGIAEMLIQALLTGFIGMLTIAGGLAFGLGGKDAAARYIEKLQK